MRSINCFEPAFGGPGNALKVAHKLILEQYLGSRVPKRSNHKFTLYRIPVYGNKNLLEEMGVIHPIHEVAALRR